MVRTLSDIDDQLCEAVKTLRRLPPAYRSPRYCNWPEIVRSFWDVWDHEAGNYREVHIRIIPTAPQITRMEEAIKWFYWLPPEQARILWARGETGEDGRQYSWRQIGKMLGINHQTAKDWAIRGIFTIYYRVNEKSLPPLPEKARISGRMRRVMSFQPIEPCPDTPEAGLS